MKTGRWTVAEDAALRDLYPDHTVRQIAVLLRREPHDVKQRARRLGLRKAGAPAAPSLVLADEIAAAKREWPTAPLYKPGWRNE